MRPRIEYRKQTARKIGNDREKCIVSCVNQHMKFIKFEIVNYRKEPGYIISLNNMKKIDLNFAVENVSIVEFTNAANRDLVASRFKEAIHQAPNRLVENNNIIKNSLKNNRQEILDTMVNITLHFILMILF